MDSDFFFLGPKPTNQVLAVLPLIAFTEDCIYVKSVVSVHPWLIGLETIGKLRFISCLSVFLFAFDCRITLGFFEPKSSRFERFFR